MIVTSKQGYQAICGLAVAILCCGCAAISRFHPQPLPEVAQAWTYQSSDIIVDDVFASAEEIFIAYRAIHHDSNQEAHFYCHARWDLNKYDDPQVYGNIAVPLTFVTKQEWNALLPVQKESVKVLAVDEWREVNTMFLSRFMSLKNGQGVEFRIGDQPAVFYRGQDEKIETSLAEDLPKGIEIVRVYTRQETEEIFVSVLKDHLERKRWNNLRQVLVSAAPHAGEFNPFIYVDLDRRLTIAFEFQPRSVGPLLPDSLVKSLRATDYAIVNSHILGMATRPFSYAFRLFTLSKDTVYDAVTVPAFILSPENISIPPLSEGPGMDLEGFEQWLTQLTGRAPRQGSMRFLIGGQEFFPRLLRLIRQAEYDIDVRMFIFDNDDYAVKVADLLKQKSLEGVRVRVLLDGMGQIMGEGKLPDDLPPGFVPPYSMPQYLQKNSRIKVRVRPNPLLRADHTKTITIDKKTGFTGGMNIGREYRYDWHDMMVEMEGPVLSRIMYEFDLAWAHAGPWGDLGFTLAKAWKKEAEIEGEGYPIRMLYTRVNNPELYRAQLEAVRRAQKYIWIHNAYFSDNEILYELIRARGRGVDVRVIFPESGNHQIMNRSNVVTANILFRNGVRVYFYPGMSHIKAAIYDGWLCTGSANFDKLSLRDNLEMNVATADERTVETLKHRLFEKDFSRSELMTQPLKSSFMDVIAETVAEQL